jgi:hypothetical protein
LQNSPADFFNIGGGVKVTVNGIRAVNDDGKEMFNEQTGSF